MKMELRCCWKIWLKSKSYQLGTINKTFICIPVVDVLLSAG